MSVDRDRRAWIAGAASAALGLAACGPLASPARRLPSERPRRIVSTTPCLDVILVEVADRSQIAALSRYSSDAYGSTILEIARTLPATQGTAEEIIALSPDLVLTGQRQTRVNTLAQLDIHAAAFPVPETVESSLAQVREVAALVGHPERGEVLVQRIEAALKAAEPTPGQRRLSTLVFMPGGFASGPGTLMDEMMQRAGLENAAARYGLSHSMSVPLEAVVADPPELLLAGQPNPGAASRAERLLQHPALAEAQGQMQRAVFPERLLFCGGPVLIQTAATLARARDAALAASA
jgi:iron complex transport system substrate-binding protein